jgi:hypothetical protein
MVSVESLVTLAGACGDSRRDRVVCGFMDQICLRAIGQFTSPNF